MCKNNVLKLQLSESINRGLFDCHTCNFYGLHRNIKFKTIFKINIVNFLLIHVFININENHHKTF
jgi:hypothetical protein